MRGDALGSAYAAVNSDGARSVVVMGHIDEIGLVVTHIDDEGYLWFAGVGGWTPSVLVAQRIRILAKDGPIVGVVGQKAPHLPEPEDKDKQLRLDHLWIDIGAADGAEARSVVRTRRPGRGRAADRRPARTTGSPAGRWTTAPARSSRPSRPACTPSSRERGSWSGSPRVSEETSFAGAYTAAFGLDPDAAIVIDVTHTSDQPNVPKRKVGEIALGKGP